MAVSSKSPKQPKPKVPDALDRLAAYSWRLIVIGLVGLAALWILRQARVVFVPIVIALFLARALSPIAGWLRRHRWRPGLAAAACIIGFVAALAGIIAVAGSAIADEAESIGPTLTEAVDEIEDWFVEDSPFDISRDSADRFRERIANEIDKLVESDREVTDQATIVAEVVTGTFLAIMLTFFMIRDGRRFADWIASRAKGSKEERLRRALNSAWATLAAYLRGAGLLGVIEAAIMGLTLWIVGASLIAPVVVLTVLGAFIPVIGAVVAGIVAVLVALVTAGTGAAIAVAIVALIVQQLDNDLLAPWIYGRALKLHPVFILLSVVAGGALFGLAGTVLAVPVVAVASSGAREYNATQNPKAKSTA